ncbi:hypothetical protein Cgig2_007056 [Carnegiea gigantea]|uniref:MPN domain-containing protein n=1 Tax=Carnegiea gigantea TaxID=171969 RepID=A0A9Q1KAT1_9CARY|nr:hypothetical protein Cgig2_007056 [Carnegiea gigantea]
MLLFQLFPCFHQEAVNAFNSRIQQKTTFPQFIRCKTRNMVKHFPSTAISCTEAAPYATHISHVSIVDSRYECSDSASHVLKDVHISAQLLEDFLQIAADNTSKDLETCGVLGASLREETFYATTLIVPKQESTSSSALHEEEIFNIQNDRSLFPLGWIHVCPLLNPRVTTSFDMCTTFLGTHSWLILPVFQTHPSQSCFMSSIDLHTQYPYQVMVPEAIAIVVAPTDKTRSYGIFRLTDPSGMTVIRECEEKGFHPHRDSSDGRPLYEQCSHVYINPNLRFEIFDLR